MQWAFLDDHATLPDAIVVSTGSNSVDVYRTTSIEDGVPTFAPTVETYFVGTAPASVTVADINDDGIPDMLIADQGSNDVSVLFGSYNSQGDWVGEAGPRLKSGGDGPIAVSVQDLVQAESRTSLSSTAAAGRSPSSPASAAGSSMTSSPRRCSTWAARSCSRRRS